MQDSAGMIGQAIGVIMYLVVLVDYYYFLPKRASLWEKSEAPEDKKKLEKYEEVQRSRAVRWIMRVMVVTFAVWLVSTLLSLF